VANFTAGTSFTDGVTNDVTAAKLNALVADAVPTANLSLNSTTGTVSNFTTSTATINGPITASTAVINVGSGQIYKDSSGNVGVGTTSPAVKLDVQGAISSTIASKTAKFDAAGNSIYTSLNDGTKDWRVGAGILSSGLFSIRNNTDAVNALNIDSSGNVGVGTTSPAQLLHVSKNSGAQIRVDSGISNVVSAIGSSASAGYVGTTSNDSFQILTNNTERLRIDSSGNCSIGTATALSKLHVHGDVTLSNTTTATTAATGGVSVPATAAGYLTVSINGTSRKIPYYA